MVALLAAAALAALLPLVANASTAGAASSGALSFADIEGFWVAAGGPASTAATAAAITGAESAFEPGRIQQGVSYCGSGSNKAGWGLWQITCGDSEPQFGSNYQLLDPWNNAEAAVAKYKGDGDSFRPWSTYEDGAYRKFLPASPPAPVATPDPGQYVAIGSRPSGTPASPFGTSDPGETYGPRPPGSTPLTSPALVMLDATHAAVAFHAAGTTGDGGHLWTWTGALGATGGGQPSNDGMAPGTSPALAMLPNGNLVAAFQAAGTGTLWLWSGAAGTTGAGESTNYGVAPGTSPSIAVYPDGSYAVAFHAAGSTGTGNHLWLWSSATKHATATNDGMAPGTSPAIAILPNGNPVVAFHASGTTGDGNHLWLWTGALGSVGGGSPTNDGMAAGTSPSMTMLPNGDPIVAFHASGTSGTGNHLWIWTGAVGSTVGGTATNDGMAAGTSPSIGLQPDGHPLVAFHASGSTGNGNHLWFWSGAIGSVGGGTPTTDGMATGTSPSLVVLPDGSYVAAFHASGSTGNGNHLWIWASTIGHGTATNDGMA
jgi:hypothetical protein